MYNCISIPLEIAFTSAGDSLASQLVSGFIDLFFAFDIIFNFVTTFVNPKTGLEVVEAKKIAKNYVK